MRNILTILVLGSLLSSCRLSRVDFSEDQLTVDYVREMIRTAGGFRPNSRIDSATRQPVDAWNKVAGPEDLGFNRIQVYRADLEEALQVQDGVIVETIKSSGRDKSGEPALQGGSYYQVYLVTTGNSASSAAVMIAAVFNADSVCTRLGPAWVGTWNAREFKFYKKLYYHTYRPKKQDKLAVQQQSTGEWRYDKKVSQERKTKSIYVDKSRSVVKVSIRLVIDQAVNINRLDAFTLQKIYRTSENSIGADKQVEFDIARIFGDPEALVFIRRK